MTFEQWAAAIPEQLTARQALQLIDAALTDAAAAVASVEAKFTGTTPPRPWPMHPELVQAIEAFQGGRLLMQRFIADGLGDVPQPKSGDAGKRLQLGGQNLYRQIGVMVEASKGTDAAELAARAAAAAGGLALKAAGTTAGGLLLLGAVLWWAWRHDE